MNGSVPTNLKNRPRIPTPDVSKESFDHNIQTATMAAFGNQQNLSAISSHVAEFPPMVQVSRAVM